MPIPERWREAPAPARSHESDRGPRLRDLPRPEEMRELLRRERARSDRTGRPYAVLVIESGDTDADPCTSRELVAALHRRLRAGDQIGWLERATLAAILPATQRADAEAVALAVRRALGLGRAPAIRVDGRQLSPGRIPADGDPLQRDSVEPGGMPRWKRAMDVIGAAVGLVALAPVLALAAALVKVSSPGPILFRQRRAGRNGAPFQLYKFRTMVVGAESMKDALRDRNEQTGPVFKIRNDPRVTRLGRWLRVTSIDELPQLWNVLRGEMSLVGPRPPTLDEVESYEAWQRRRLSVTPGLTCIWQVSGRSRIGFVDWVRMDLRYIERRSFLQDLRLLARTVPVVLSTRGAH